MKYFKKKFNGHPKKYYGSEGKQDLIQARRMTFVEQLLATEKIGKGASEGCSFPQASDGLNSKIGKGASEGSFPKHWMD